MDHKSGAKFIKRVVGLPGDVITPGPTKRNPDQRKSLDAPSGLWNAGIQARGRAGLGGGFVSGKPRSRQTRILYIGDNLPHSLDSRTKDFGLVSLNEIEGQAKILYFSPRLSRIGCKIR